MLGWLVALPVPLLVGLAPSWSFIVAANILLGINQGLAWSMTVVMKIDLAGPARRGLALGLNEAAGYLGVATTALASGALAATYAPRTVVWVGASLIAGVGLLAAIVFVRDTARARRGRAASARGPHVGASTRPRLGLPDRDVQASGPARVQPGRAGQQPQRRAGLGPHAALPGRARRDACARSRSSQPRIRSSGDSDSS